MDASALPLLCEAECLDSVSQKPLKGKCLTNRHLAAVYGAQG